MWSYLVMFLLAGVGCLLMFIILLQRGRGGGLAGAFGGMGGQSAFGTKAGDVFTKITVVLAVVWVVLAGASGFVLRADAERRYPGAEESNAPTIEQPAGEQEAGETAPLPPAQPQAPEGTADEAAGTSEGESAKPQASDAPAADPEEPSGESTSGAADQP